jgi:hypothetical protein
MRVSKSWSVLFLGIALFNPSAHAGRGVDSSGGGNAIVCFDSSTIATRLRQEKLAGSGFIADSDIQHITSVELLDVHKAKIPSLKMGELVPVTPRVIEARPGETPDQYSERLKKRFEVYFPGIIKILEDGQSSFKSVKPYAHGLMSIDDVNSVENFNTETCVKATIIAQYYEPAGNYIAYDARIFALPMSVFPATDRALSFWHEYLYLLAKINRQAQSSDSTQTLLGALITHGVTLKELLSLVDVTVGSSTEDTYASKYVEENFVTKFVKQVNDDLIKENLETDLWHDISYYVEDQKGLFESVESAFDRVEKMAKSDPRYNGIPAAALKLYTEKWRPELYSTPQVSKKALKLLDDAITRHFNKINRWVAGGRNGSTVYCSIKFSHFLLGLGRWDAIQAILNNPDIAVFDVALPNGDEL